jgi:catalase
MTIDRGMVSYSPNSLQENTPQPDTEHGYIHYTEKVNGRKVRERSESFKDHYRQATLFWNSMSATEKQHIVEAFHFEVSGVMDKQIRQRVVDMFNNVDGQLAIQIATGIGAVAPANPGGTGITTSSPAVSQENTIRVPRTRKVAILAENGFNYPEVTQVMDALKNAGVYMEVVSKDLGMLTSVDGRQLEVNKNYVSTGSIMYDAVYVTGGRQCVDTLLAQGDALHFINEAFKHAKAIGATNEGVDLIAASQIRNVPIAGPETQAQLVNELGVVTIRNAADMGYFSGKFVEAIAQHRHWIRQQQKELVPA